MELDFSAMMKEKLAQWPAEQVLIWAQRMFGDKVVMTSSFQSQSVPLLHLVSQYTPELTVLFIDTGYHFPETLIFRDTLTESLKLNVRTVKAEPPPPEFEYRYSKLYRSDPDECCRLRKVVPLEKALAGCSAWITGIRHDQTELRQNAAILETKGSLIKINPMVDWSHEQIENYIDENALPRHPLESRGYQSIGCSTCTHAVIAPSDYRFGRWLGYNKTECGIHSVTFSTTNSGMKLA